MPYDVQQLEGAERLALGQQLLGNDSLERRNRATQEENHKAANRSIDLGVIQDLKANISSAHEHRSENDGNEGEVHADRANLPVEDILENACKYGHGAAEHLRVRGEWDGNLIQCQTVVLQTRVRCHNIHDEDHTHQEQHFHLAGLDGAILEEVGRSVFHNRGIDRTRDHVYLAVTEGGKAHHGDRHGIGTLEGGKQRLVERGHANDDEKPCKNPEHHDEKRI